MAGRTVILLSMFALTTHNVNSQFYDLFQGFQPFIQNLQTARPEYNIYTQNFHQRRPKPASYITENDSSSNEERRHQASNVNNDRSSKETTKSTHRRKTTQANIFNLNIFTTPKPVRKHKNNSSHRHNDSSKINKNQAVTNSNRRQFYDDSANNVADYNTRPNVVTTKPAHAITRTTESSRLNYANTRPTATLRPNYLTTKNIYDYSRPQLNFYTTENPLYNRPGVKPAVVDNNKPPITNRPATNSPDIYKPINTRPENPRPANIRPEVSRPVSSSAPSRADGLYRPATTRPFAVYPRPTDSSAIKYPEEPDTSPEAIVGLDGDKMSNVEKRRYLDLAERMCDKYKALNIKKVEAIPLVPSPQPVRVNVSVCPPTNVPLVVGGKVVTIEEFPHMALLGWTRLQGGGYSWKCGGSLVSDQYVLTAGHCAYQQKDDSVVIGAPRVVQLGSSYLDDTGALVMKVLSVVTHPKYVQTRSYHDIALVKMVKPVIFSQVVKPACLGVPPGVGEPIIATGWGRTEFGGTQSMELRSVSIPVWDMNDCSQVLGTSRKLPDGPSRDSQICAGEKNGGKDTCQGDSGGPAQIQDGCAWRLVAVTSVGRSCGAANTPALYATLDKAFIAAQIFGKASTASSTNNADRNQNNNHQNPIPVVANSNWNDNNRRGENNNNGNRNNNHQNNSNKKQDSEIVNNQNWNNNNQPTNNKHNQYWNGNTQNENNNGYTNNYENSPNNGYIVTESNVNYANNNRQQFNNDRQNNHRNENNDYKIVYPQQNNYNRGNSNNNYGTYSYTTHRPSYNNGYWSNYDY